MLGLYVHIPFCARKCRYCDFISLRAASREQVRDYLRALDLEIESLGGENERLLDTLYVGGGTPTILTEGELAGLFEGLGRRFPLRPGAEVTVEANPGTLDAGRARRLRALGVNRVSLGVQSLRDANLAALGRIHDAAQAREAFGALREAGFTNIGADLIYGLPGQGVGDWLEDLAELLALAPEHLSLYALGIERGTPFHRLRAAGRLTLPEDETVVEMYREAERLAGEHGYEHYEISNWAHPGRRSRHNTLYWTGGDYLGAGAGAHSFLGGERPLRRSNVRDPARYVARMLGGKGSVARHEFPSAGTLAAEALMTGLRMLAGVEIEGFRRRHGLDPLGFFGPGLGTPGQMGWLEVREGRLRLTPEGIVFSDEVFVCLF